MKCSSRAKVYALAFTFLAFLGGHCAGAQLLVHAPIPRRIVGLDYPWFARLGGVQGRVEVVATISPEGTVRKVQVLSGPEPLARAVNSTLSKWLFSEGCTATAGGCEAKVVFTFTLSGVCDIGERCPSDFEVDLPGSVRISAKHAHAIVN